MISLRCRLFNLLICRTFAMHVFALPDKAVIFYIYHPVELLVQCKEVNN